MINIKNKNQFLAFSIILGIVFFFVGNKIGEAYRITDGDVMIKLNYVSDNLYSIILNIHFSLNFNDILCGLATTGCWGMFVLYFLFARTNFRVGEEHGSARWGIRDDIRKFIDKNEDNNMIFTQTEQISLNTRITMRSNNILVIGGTGTGKTRFFLKPNIMQMHSSYVITDPKGNVLDDVGNMLFANGYDIRTFNTVDFSKSMYYNPFGFIKSEADIKIFVDIFMSNTKEKGEKANDPFWENAERLVYMALIGYIIFFLPEEEHNFATLNHMINQMEVHEDDESYMNMIDFMFKEAELGTEQYIAQYGDDAYLDLNSINDPLEPQPNHFCVTQYKKFKLAAGVIKYR